MAPFHDKEHGENSDSGEKGGFPDELYFIPDGESFGVALLINHDGYPDGEYPKVTSQCIVIRREVGKEDRDKVLPEENRNMEDNEYGENVPQEEE
jgi:hypothetical protein